MAMPNYFDAFEEFKAGRYEYNEALGFGKFDFCHYTTDDRGIKTAIEYYMCVPDIAKRLPTGCFVPLSEHIEQWSEYKLGENWREDPDGFANIFIAKTAEICDGFGGGVLITMQYIPVLIHGVVQMREAKDPQDLLCYCRIISKDRVGDCAIIEAHSPVYIPIFFTKDFYEANIAT